LTVRADQYVSRDHNIIADRYSASYPNASTHIEIPSDLAVARDYNATKQINQQATAELPDTSTKRDPSTVEHARKILASVVLSMSAWTVVLANLGGT